MLTTFQSLSTEYNIREERLSHKPEMFSKPIDVEPFLCTYEWIRANLKPYTWKGTEELWYKGYGLTYDSNYQGNIYTQVLGDKSNPSYEDGMSFNTLNDLGQMLFKSIKINLTPIRSRIAVIDNVNPLHEGWHVDESPYETLRLNIPIITDNNYLFQIEDQLPIHLDFGKAYWWDTSVPHRVFCNQVSKIERAHLVLGFSPWFELKDNTWVPNQFFNKVHPLNIFNEIL